LLLIEAVASPNLPAGKGILALRHAQPVSSRTTHRWIRAKPQRSAEGHQHQRDRSTGDQAQQVNQDARHGDLRDREHQPEQRGDCEWVGDKPTEDGDGAGASPGASIEDYYALEGAATEPVTGVTTDTKSGG
jgi:hypothetical protein